jgi:hypothetical protein
MSAPAPPVTKPIDRSAGHPPLAQQIQERVVEFGQHCLEAVTSGAWFWPVRGLLFSIMREYLTVS